MPQWLWDKAENYADRMHHDRSSWVRSLVTEALRDAGELPSSGAAETEIMLRELVATHGAEAVRAKLAELASEAALAEGARG